jgi:hypothetical protein
VVRQPETFMLFALATSAFGFLLRNWPEAASISVNPITARFCYVFA